MGDAMSRTLTVELSDKQYAALVMRLQRLEMPEVPIEDYLAQIPLFYSEAEAKAIERLDVYEEAYRLQAAMVHTLMRVVWHIGNGKQGGYGILDWLIKRGPPDQEETDAVVEMSNQFMAVAQKQMGVEITPRKSRSLTRAYFRGRPPAAGMAGAARGEGAGPGAPRSGSGVG